MSSEQIAIITALAMLRKMRRYRGVLRILKKEETGQDHLEWYRCCESTTRTGATLHQWGGDSYKYCDHCKVQVTKRVVTSQNPRKFGTECVLDTWEQTSPEVHQKKFEESSICFDGESRFIFFLKKQTTIHCL